MQEEIIDTCLQSLINWTPVHFGEKNDYEVTEFFRAQDKRNGQMVFVKRIDLSRDYLNEYQAEVKALNSLNSDNIVYCIENGIESFPIEHKMHSFGYIILPYSGDIDMCDALANYQWKKNEDDLIKFSYNLINAINHIHSRGFIHRDMKLENIVINEISIDQQRNKFTFNPDSFNIIDFGSSYSCYDHNCKDDKNLIVFKRTQTYSPPEFINNGILTEKYDIFSCGIILYSVVAGHFPKFDFINDMNGVHIKFLPYDINDFFDKNEWDGISEEMQDLIKSMLAFDPLYRPSTDDLLKSNAFQTQISLFGLIDDEERYLY